MFRPLSHAQLSRLLRAIDREQVAIERSWHEPDYSREELQYRHDTLAALARAIRDAGHARNGRVPQAPQWARGCLPVSPGCASA